MIAWRTLSGSVLAALAWAVLAAGPAPAEGGDVGTVKGVVTVNGRPLAAGRVFVHLANDQFVGAKIKDGRYAVDRVPTGRHRVSVEGKGVGARYTAEATTPVEVEVDRVAPASGYDIELD